MIFESANPTSKLIAIVRSNKNSKLVPVRELSTYSGNIVAVLSEHLEVEFDSFKREGVIQFQVFMSEEDYPKTYRLSLAVGQTLKVALGQSYATYVDNPVSSLPVELSYNAHNIPDLRKLRFQLSTLRQEANFTIRATLHDDQNAYNLNTIFQKSIGGVLAEPQFTLCKAEACAYKLNIDYSGVRAFNLESFLIGAMETLNINHFDEYYDRVYNERETVIYQLPYEESMEGMDISISVVTVKGNTGLYVNAKSLPTFLAKYDWKEVSPLGKRITISWDELVQMRAEKSVLYIAVSTETPGEYLLKVDAHEKGSRGRLTSGVVEAGFVQYNEIHNYLYTLEIFKDQKVVFDLHLTVTSGDANLYLRQCNDLATCKLKKDDLTKSNVFKQEDNQNSKGFSNILFECKMVKDVVPTICQFVVGVHGKENHGTHFELSLHESSYHRLLIPGHSIQLQISAGESRFFKLSSSTARESEFILYYESLWGAFDIFVSKYS